MRPPQAPDRDAMPPVCPRIDSAATLTPQAMARCTGWREELRVYETPQDATMSDGYPGVACVPSCEYDALGSSPPCSRADSPPRHSPLRECS